MVSINFCLCSLLSCLHLIASCLCFETTPCNWMQNKRLTVAVASSDSHFHMIPCDVKQRCKTKSSIMLHSPIRDSLYPSSSFNIQCWKKREVSSATIRCQMEECDLFTVEAPPVNGQFNWMEPLSLSLSWWTKPRCCIFKFVCFDPEWICSERGVLHNNVMILGKAMCQYLFLEQQTTEQKIFSLLSIVIFPHLSLGLCSSVVQSFHPL